MSRTWLSRLVVLLAIGFAFTPYFTTSFLLVIALVSLWNPWKSSFFTSYFSRLIVHFLLFDAFVMIVSMYCWFFKVDVYPIVVVIAYLLLYFFVRKNLPEKRNKTWVNFNDLLAMGLALVGIVILLACFYLPSPSLADSVRIITSGYDNSAHMSLIETTFRAHGYVYGSYKKIGGQVAYATLTAYPQGWHMVNALWWQGTGADIFGGTDASLRINFYIATLLLWQLVATYLFTKASLYVVQLLGYDKKIRQWGVGVGFIAANLLIQLLAFWGTAYYGFPTYIAAIAYLILLVTVIISVVAEKSENKLLGYYVTLVCAAATTLAWLLPMPFVLLIIVVAFVDIGRGHVRQHIHGNKGSLLLYAAATLVIVATILSQVVLNYLYSVEGGNQIDDKGGIFSLSSLLVLVVLGFTTFVTFSIHGTQKYIAQTYLTVVAPLLAGVLFIYVYQMVTTGQTRYFFTKLTATMLVIVGIFFSVAVVKVLSGLQFDKTQQLYTALVAVVSIGSIVAFSGQSLLNFTTLLNRSVIKNSTADTIASLVKNGQLFSSHVFVLSGQTSSDIQASVFTTSIPLHYDSCVSDVEWLVGVKQVDVPNQTRLCTKEGEHFIFVTTPSTNGLFAGAQDANVKTIVSQ